MLHGRNWRESLHVLEFRHPPKFLCILAATLGFQITTGLTVLSTTGLPVLSVALFLSFCGFWSFIGLVNIRSPRSLINRS